MKSKFFIRLIGILFLFGLISFMHVYGTSNAIASEDVPGVTDDTIKIGFFGPLTGPIALYGTGAYMADAIFKELYNKKGGIHGRKIETVMADTGCQPVKGVAAIKKLIHQDKVFMLNGGACSNVCLAAKEEFLQTGIPWMAYGAAAHGIYYPTEKNIFTPQITSNLVAETIADFALTKPGTKRVAVIKHTDEWAMSFYKPLIKYLKEKYELSPVIDVTIERGVTDATPQVLKIKSAKPDFVFAIVYVVATSTFIRDAYKLGMQAPIVGTTAVAVDEQYKRVGIPEATKTFFTPHWYKYPLDSPGMSYWKDLLAKYYPKIEFGGFTGYGLAGHLAIPEALKKIGRNITREKLIKEWETFNNWTTDNYPMAYPISWSASNHIGMTRDAMSVMHKGKIQVIYNWKDYENLQK